MTVTSGGRLQVARRVGGGSFQSAADPRLHFGLGPSDHVASVEVRWPSGRVDRYQDLKADAGYQLKEGAREGRGADSRLAAPSLTSRPRLGVY